MQSIYTYLSLPVLAVGKTSVCKKNTLEQHPARSLSQAFMSYIFMHTFPCHWQNCSQPSPEENPHTQFAYTFFAVLTLSIRPGVPCLLAIRANVRRLGGVQPMHQSWAQRKMEYCHVPEYLLIFVKGNDLRNPIRLS